MRISPIILSIVLSIFLTIQYSYQYFYWYCYWSSILHNIPFDILINANYWSSFLINILINLVLLSVFLSIPLIDLFSHLYFSVSKQRGRRQTTNKVLKTLFRTILKHHNNIIDISFLDNFIDYGHIHFLMYLCVC